MMDYSIFVAFFQALISQVRRVLDFIYSCTANRSSHHRLSLRYLDAISQAKNRRHIFATPGAHSLESLMRDSSEINHCLILISFDKIRFNLPLFEISCFHDHRLRHFLTAFYNKNYKDTSTFFWFKVQYALQWIRIFTFYSFVVVSFFLFDVLMHD